MAEEPKQERRAFLAIALAMGVLLVWNVLFPAKSPPPAPVSVDGTARETTSIPAAVDTPALEESSAELALAAADSANAERRTAPSAALTANDIARADSSATVERKIVRVANPNLALEIDGRGARLTKATLPEFSESEDVPVQLIPKDGPGALGTILVFDGRTIPLDGEMFRLVEDTGARTSSDRRLVWELARESFTLRKTIVFPPTGNLIRVEHELLGDPPGLAGWGLGWAGGMRATEELKGNTAQYFQGSALAEGKVQKKAANALDKGPIEFPGRTFFVAVQNKYFVAAIVPEADHRGPAKLSRVEGSGENTAHPSVAGEIRVERTPGVAANVVRYDVYVGPLDLEKLSATKLGIEGVVDLGYAWVRPLSQLLLKLLIGLHEILPNYGVVIILFSTLITLLFFPLTFKSAKSMRDMAALKPRLDALKEKYGKDSQKLSEATMKLYKEAGVNPFGGCLPLLLQMPIFFALYAVLFHTIELRGAPFFGWISDLSQPDVIFHLPFAIPFVGSGLAILPIIMGVTSYIQSKQTTVDPSQQAMVIVMPIVMTFVFFSFPSGLVLYWLTNNVLTIAQRFMLKPSPLAGATVGG